MSKNPANNCDHWKCNIKDMVLLIRALRGAALSKYMAGSHFSFMAKAEG